MADDFIKSTTGIRTIQAIASGETIVIDKPFMLTDLIVSNNSNGMATIVMQDEENTHIIKSIKPNGE